MEENEYHEPFSVQRRIIRFEPLPEMFFFEPDEDPKTEAEVPFITVDELFRSAALEEDAEQADAENLHRDSILSFTLIPRHRYQFIDASLARIIRRSLAATSIRESVRLVRVRIRPIFIQWQAELPAEMDSRQLITAYRDDLERQFAPYRESDEDELFWADDCLIQPAENEMIIRQVIRFVNKYQKE